MSDPAVAPVVPTDQTNPLDAGHTTTESGGSKLVVIVSSILAVLGTAATLLDKAAGIFPADQKGVGLWIAVSSAIVGGITQVAYTVSRTQLKIAAIKAGKVTALVLALGFGLARADTIGGGCFGGHSALGQVCAMPDVAVGLAEINLRTGDVITSVDPMLGYTISAWSDQWYTTSLACHVGFRQTSNDAQRILPACGVGFAKYLRGEIGRPFKGDGDWRIFLGIGNSLGGTTPSAK